MGKRLEIDCKTGKQKIVDISPEEIAASENHVEPEKRPQQKIAELEALQTPRRIREAALGIDDGWLQNLNDQIEEIREKI